MPKITIAIDFEGSLADSLRAIANLIDDYGPAFFADAPSFYAIHNDGIINRVEITEVTDESGDDPVDAIDRDVWFEECPECGHREISDGYGGNDCPECCEAMKVKHCSELCS
jgi:hypothetical protein